MQAAPRACLILVDTGQKIQTGGRFLSKIQLKGCLRVEWAFQKCFIKVKQHFLKRLMKISLRIDYQICIITAQKI